MKWRYFNLETKPDSKLKGVDPIIITMADVARHYAKIPFYPVSGLRSKEYNAAVGGVPNSAHVKGLGVDFRCSDNQMLFKMLKGILLAGFHRIGLNGSIDANGRFHIRGIHVDTDPDKSPNVLWIKIYDYPK